MGISPCLRCDLRFIGEAKNVYLTSFLGEEREAYRFVVCSPCCDELLVEWRNRALYRDDDGEWAWHEPSTDGQPRTGPSEPQQGPSERRPGRQGLRRPKRGSGRSQRDQSSDDDVPWN